MRGGIIALDADRNCNFKGQTQIRMSKFVMEDVSSVLDGGSLIYSRTDCFLDVGLQEVRISNARSNIIPNSSLVTQMGVGTPLVDDIEGGGLIKLTSNTLRLLV